MAEPFIAEVRARGLSYAPRGWSRCDGSLMAIAQNTALFSLVSTKYGGDGRTTFGLPNLDGRAVMGPGNGPGLTPRQWGEPSGQVSVYLSTNEIPSHTHSAHISKLVGTEASGAGAYNARRFDVAGQVKINAYAEVDTEQTDYADASMVSTVGNGQAHINMQPFLTFEYCIAVIGTYPSRS